jgi:hypothetical protein
MQIMSNNMTQTSDSQTIKAQTKPAQAIEVFLDHSKIFFNEQPFIDGGTTLVEFRPIFEKLGLRVEWDAVTNTVYGSKEKFRISLPIGSKTSTVKGEAKQLLVAPRIINGHTFIRV